MLITFDTEMQRVTLRLDGQGSPQLKDSLIRVPRGSVVVLALPEWSPLLPGAVVLTNLPAQPADPFERSAERRVPVGADGLAVLGPVDRAGAFQARLGAAAPALFICEPTLPMPLAGLVLQTVLSPCLGPANEWAAALQHVADTGYNMVHFTPVQELGSSGSCYSIARQDRLSGDLFPGTDPAQRLALLGTALQRLRDDLGLLSMVDIVLNHTAHSSRWLVQHPEATYSLQKCPHLLPAYQLDNAISELSVRLELGTAHGVSAEMNSEAAVLAAHAYLWERVVPELRLEEFYMIDEEAAFAAFPPSQAQGEEGDLEENPRGGRFCVRLSAAALRRAGSAEGARALARIRNQKLRAQFEADMRSAREATRGAALHLWLGERGGRGRVTATHTFVHLYFTFLPTGGAAANNGFIWGGDTSVDFAARPARLPTASNPYLRRDLVVWGDCVKLRYGASPSDSPWLWAHMTRYCQDMASTFDGFRVDNAHGTPVHVAEAMLDAARGVNPELYVSAELFTGNVEADARICARLGLDSLVRESMQADDESGVLHSVYTSGGSWPVGPLGPRDPAAPAPLPAMLFDCTHDNAPPAEKRTAADALPNAALTAMAACAIGSVRGYDELVPRNLSVVSERRRYQAAPTGGIVRAKALLNRLHRRMADEGLEETHVWRELQRGWGDVCVVKRCHPTNGMSVVLVSRSAFGRHLGPPADRPLQLRFTGCLARLELAAGLHVGGRTAAPSPNVIDDGLPSTLTLSETECGHMANLEQDEARNELVVTLRPEAFAPGSVLVLRVQRPPAPSACQVCEPVALQALRALAEQLSLPELGLLLFSCDAEERDRSGGRRGAYQVPNGAPLFYCGLAGPVSALRYIRRTNDPLHPLLEHLRHGTWLADYLCDRLADCEAPALQRVREWLQRQFAFVAQHPRSLRARAFGRVVTAAYDEVCDAALARMPAFVRDATDPFVRDLAMTSLMFVNEVPSAPLLRARGWGVSLCAGLPHFSTGFMRNWGRDTFISLRGLLLVTGRWAEARQTLEAYASVCRHGLIPNLMDGGSRPRYNARDATWWFLQAVQDYCEFVGGTDVLQEGGEVGAAVRQIMRAHVDGIDFVEEGAGPDIDAHMRVEGFRVTARVDPATGLVSGGNLWNCGTWMDKMGSSDVGGNRGEPATPRDGAAVEINGLAYSAVAWLAGLGWSHPSPTRPDFTYAEWRDRLRAGFEPAFFSPERGVYRDTVGSARAWQDEQFRPNQVVAMAVAPTLFDPEHARGALDRVQAQLLGPLGVRTLSPDDLAYRGNYDNAASSTDKATADGWNYHQGPEWLWPLGYYLRARLHFSPGFVARAGLERHAAYIRADEALALPELTNKDGARCHHSCAAQAWSSATLLDALSLQQ